MPVPRTADPLSGRRRTVRGAAGALALLSGLGAGSASAVLLDTFVWSSDNTAYNSYAQTCPNVGGVGCGANGSPKPQYGYATTVNRSDPGTATPTGGTIFGWGAAAEVTLHSTLTWVNDGLAFNLAQVQLTSNGRVGTGLPYYPGAPPVIPLSQGSGVSPSWEWSLSAFASMVVEAQVQISVAGIIRYTGSVISGYGPAVSWFDGTDTLQTPVNLTAALGGTTVGTGQRIEIRLFQSVWQGGTIGGQGVPDVQYAPISIAIFDTVPTPATLALFGLGLVLLRPWRNLKPAGAAATP